MKHKICIITIYFGKLPIYFKQWLDSCGWNPDFDFLIITDQEIDNRYANVRVQKSSLKEIKARFESALCEKVKLDMPYKLCDYKPLYGITFKEELDGYDFWGHCDVDLIWGNLSKYITDEILNKFDKVFPLGHLSLYRNSDIVNNYFRLPGSQRGNYKEVIGSNKSCVFDERYGINKIFEFNSLPIYLEETAADIGFRNQRMIIAGNGNTNYRHQVFFIDDGRCMRAFLEEGGKMNFDEFAYIHMQKRKYCNTIDGRSYFVGQNTFSPLIKPITSETIEKVNPSRSQIYEKLEYFVKDYKFRITRRIKQMFIK